MKKKNPRQTPPPAMMKKTSNERGKNQTRE
jgi:hypothetical protein